jgi:hypothetical protein
LSIFVWGVFSGSFAFCASLNEELNDAARRGDMAGVQALLSKGADVNAKVDGWLTDMALSVAKRQRHKEIVQLLKQAGAKK